MTFALDAISPAAVKADPRLDLSRYSQGGFGAALRGAAAPEPQADPNVNPKLMQAARDLVGLTMIYPILKLAQNDPFKSELFHGGQAEDAFGQQLNDHLTRRIMDRSDFPLVKAVYDTFDRKGTMTEAGLKAQGRGVDRHG